MNVETGFPTTFGFEKEAGGGGIPETEEVEVSNVLPSTKLQLKGYSSGGSMIESLHELKGYNWDDDEEGKEDMGKRKGKGKGKKKHSILGRIRLSFYLLLGDTS